MKEPRGRLMASDEAIRGARLDAPELAAGVSLLEPLLTTKQVAELLQLHPKTVERMARAGRIPSHRVSGRARFQPSDIASWLAARRTACHD